MDQLYDESLELRDGGDATWAYLSSLEDEFDPKSFYQAVRSFYVATLKKILRKFSFGNLF